MSKPKTQSWREVIDVHAATNLFPMMSPNELRALQNVSLTVNDESFDAHIMHSVCTGRMLERDEFRPGDSLPR